MTGGTEGDDATFVNNSDYFDSPNAPESDFHDTIDPAPSPILPAKTSSPDPPMPPLQPQKGQLLRHTTPELAPEQVGPTATSPQLAKPKSRSPENPPTEKSPTESSANSPTGTLHYPLDDFDSVANSTMVDLQGSPQKGRKRQLDSRVATKTVLLSVPSSSSAPLSFSQQLSQLNVVSPSKRRERERVPQDETPTPRLVIDRLVLTNFKSYAGVQEIGPFNASFSAVVGPNGSGKSNVIDSMLFVFGFRASKMRQGKLSELIHNSEGGEKLPYCQVDIHFVHVVDDPVMPNAATRVPGSELVISRRATNTNGSQYYINGKSSTYTEVTTYLRGQGIDLDHKRFLILQGEVESIAQMKPKAEKENDDGLLEYLEDIIGTSQYKPLIDESLIKVDELNQACTEKENRFELVESDTSMLEEKKTEALRFLEMERKLTNKRSIQYQLKISQVNKSLHENVRVEKEISDKLKEEVAKNKELSEEVDEIQTKKSTLQKNIADINKEMSALSQKEKTLKSKSVSLEEKLKSLGNKTKKIEKAKKTAETSLSSSITKLDNLKAAENQLKDELGVLNLSLEVEKHKLSELRIKLTEKTSHLSKEIEEIQTKLEPYNDRLKEKESTIELIQSEIEMVETQRRGTENKLREASQRLIDIKKEGKAKESELDALENKLNHISEQILLGEEQCQNSKKKLETRRVRLAAARLKTQDAVNSVASAQNKNKVLSSLMRLAKSGRIEGFYGRLGDLGQIDDKYDVAISTACPALDSMVVETVETAQACIDYLRKNKLGYANFVCLNKLRRFDMEPIKTPGNPMTVKRLFDLIVPAEPKFLPAFYSKMFNTLVATNLQEAKTVAYGPKRFKVVTLDGKIVDTSGTMSGGGNSFARGAMKLSSNAVSNDTQFSEEDIEQMREELKGMESNVEGLNSECQEMEANLRKLKDLKPETEFGIQKVQLDIQLLISEKKELSTICKQLMTERESEDATSEVNNLIENKLSDLAAIQKEKDELKLQMIDSETRVALLEEKIMEAGGVELKVQNSKLDSIKQQIEIIIEKTSGDVMATKKLENDIRRFTKVVTDSDKELLSNEQETKIVEEEFAEKRNQVTELVTQSAKLDGQKSEEESNLERLSDELEELSAKINEFKSDEIELRNQLEKVSGVVKRNKWTLKEAQEALQDLTIRDSGPYIDWMPAEEQTKYNGDKIDELSDEELERVNMAEVEEEIDELNVYMKDVKVDIEVLKEYGRKKQELEMRRKELNESVEERDSLKNHCEELKRKRLDEFMEGFNKISLSLKEMYQMITMGGNAELELVDSLDPFSEGILFSVMPPKKSWKNISNISGGEKTLSSLALVFALHKYKPTPLYVMDEIDAALDFRNVSIVANYIKERTKNAQFVVISLRNNMFELAQQLVGIYKVENRTRSISLQNRELIGAKEK